MKHRVDRRRFNLGLAASALIPTCLCSAHAKARPTGCWLSSADGSDEIAGTAFSSGREDVDKFCWSELARLKTAFRLNPSFNFYDDATSPNAFASQASLDASKPDGALFVGISLATSIYDRHHDRGALPLVGVLAHEFGHLLQFKKGLSSDWGVHFELSSDYLAGWYLAQTRPNLPASKDDVASLFASLGSTTAFANADYHGSPKQRSRMLLYGAGLHGVADTATPGATITNPLEALTSSMAGFNPVGGN